MQYVQYKNGYFVLNQAILPELVKSDKNHQNTILLAVYNKYFNYKWGNKTQFQKFEEINSFVASLIHKILEENQ